MISVIMPVYNVKEYVKEAIESVLNQSFKDFELIIVDDGSTDGSEVICDQYASKDNRIHVIHKKNGGLSSARNCGLDVMKGDLVTFIDSDDVWNHNYLELLEKAKREANAEISICSYQVFIDKYQLMCLNHKKKTYTGKKFVHLIFGPQMIGGYAWGKLFDSSIFKDCRFPIGRLYEDIFTIPYVIYPVKKIVYLYDQLYYYRKRAGSILNKYTPERADELFALSKLADYAIEKHDLLLHWYACINTIRSYLEVKHRFKKYSYNFDSIKIQFEHKKSKLICGCFFPWIGL